MPARALPRAAARLALELQHVSRQLTSSEEPSWLIRQSPTIRATCRLRPQPPHALAGRRAHRRAVRPQLRGGRRELRAARRPRRRSVPLRDDRRAARSRRAPHEHGASTNTARAPASGGCCGCSRARAAAHRVRRRHGDGAQPGGGRGLRRGRPRDRLARLALDQLPGRRRRPRSASTSRRAIEIHTRR